MSVLGFAGGSLAASGTRTLVASPFGFVIGVSLGALGGGGSILVVPALVYGAGQDPRGATTTSLAVVGLAAVAGMAGHWRAGRVRVASGLAFGAVGLGGSIVGSQLNAGVDPNTLLLAFSGLVLVAAWRMLASRPVSPAMPQSLSAAYVAAPPVIDAATVLKVLGAGTVVGFLTGFFGVGGGFVIVPALVLVLRFPMPEAVGTSLLVIAVNSTFALVQRVGTTGIEWRVAVPFALAALLGVGTGQRVAARVPAGALTRAFAALLVAVAVFVAVRAGLAL